MPPKRTTYSSETGAKRCYLCGEWLPLCMYHRNRAKADGLSDACKPCRIDRWKEYRSRNHEKVLSAVRNWQKRPENKRRRVAYMREYLRRPEVKAKHAARNAVKDALLSGRIVRPPLALNAARSRAGLIFMPTMGITPSHLQLDGSAANATRLPT
jgi:hypothetical protein